MAFKKLKKWMMDDEDNLMGTEDEYYAMSEADALKEADKTGNKMI